MAPSFDCASNLLCTEDGSHIESWENEAKPLGIAGNTRLSALPFFAVEDDETVSVLVQKECDHMPREDYLQRFRTRTLDINARREGIGLILKVHSAYNFGPLTAYLSINYLDRFLSIHRLQQGIKAWMIRLLSVACLSLAAKMEETHVPFLLDLQSEDAGFIFDAQTIQRMELLILSTLKWRMRSITPLSFVDYFVSGVEGNRTPPRALASRAIELILSTIKEIDFLEYRPSAIAAAAVLCASEEVVPLHAAHYKRVLSSCIYVDKERMFGCYNLIQELIIESSWMPKKKPVSGSLSSDKTPVGVLEAACVSWGSEKTSGTLASSLSIKPYASVAAKRRKLNEFCSALFLSEAQQC